MGQDRKDVAATWRGAPRFFITARLTFMVFAPAPLLFGFAPGTTALQKAFYASGLAFIEAGGILLLYRLWRGRGLSGITLTVLPAIDIAGLAVMELVASQSVPDPLYPVLLILPVLYALLLPKRQAIEVAVLAGLAFAGAVSTHQTWHYWDVLVYAERVVCVPLVTWLVAVGTELQRRQLERMQVVAGISEAAHTSLDAEFLTPRTVEVLADVLGLSFWRLYVLERESRAILFEARFAAGLVSISSSVPDWRGDLPYESRLGTFHADPQCEPLPILVQKEVEAVFCAPPHELRRLTPEDRMVLQATARELLVAVENRRLYGIAMKLSMTDSLTGLYNRRHLAGRIAEEIGRARRYDKPVSLLMLDGDDFKRVNDRYGHRVGDEVLVQLAALMRASVREVDVIARYGGEEFCILLPETDAVGARQVAEKVCGAVAAYSFGPERVRLTLSCGLATFPQHVETAEDLQQVADSALYEAKSHGKNRVCVPKGRRASA